MVSIDLPDETEALYFFSYLKKRLAEQNIDRQVEITIADCFVQIDHKKDAPVPSLFIKQAVSHTLAHYSIHFFEKRLAKEILKEIFRYSDEQEISEILLIMEEIIRGKRKDIPHQPKDQRKELLEEEFFIFLHETTSFTLTSFFRFRLKKYKQLLQSFLELAIDEYKMEQEYQSLIEEWRTYVQKRKTLCETIYLYEHPDGFQMFTDVFEEISFEKLPSLIDENLYRYEELQQTPPLLASLLTLSPKRIILYTKQSDSLFIQTIQNIFQESVIIKSKSLFLKEKTRVLDFLTTKAYNSEQ